MSSLCERPACSRISGTKLNCAIASVFCALAAFRREWQHVAMVWAVIFMASLATGRVLSIMLDGMPVSLLNWYLVVEAAMAGFGLWILTRQDAKPGLKR